MKQIEYKKEYHKQKEITFAINMTTYKIEKFYNYLNGEKIRYRLGKKLLKNAMREII